MATYVMLSTDWAHERMRQLAEGCLEKVLGTEVSIGRVNFRPFSRLEIDDVTVYDDFSEPAFTIKDIDARIELYDFLFRQKFIVDYATVAQLNAKIYKETPESPLNIGQIIARLSKPKQPKEDKYFEFGFNNVELINSWLSYDVLSAPLDTFKFDPSHIAINDLNASVHAPIVSSEAYGIRLRRLHFSERSGLTVKNITADFSASADSLVVKDLSVLLSRTEIHFGPICSAIEGVKSIGEIGKKYPVNIDILPGSNVCLPDLAPFSPALSKYEDPVAIEMNVSGIVDSIRLDKLYIEAGKKMLCLEASGTFLDMTQPSIAYVDHANIDLSANSLFLLNAIRGKLSTPAANLMDGAGEIKAYALVNGNLENANLTVEALSDYGEAAVKGTVGYKDERLRCNVVADAIDIDLGPFANNPDLGIVNAKVSADGYVSKYGSMRANVNAEIADLVYKGYDYQDITATIQLADTIKSVTIDSNDPWCDFSVNGALTGRDKGLKRGILVVDARNICPDSLHLTDKYPGCLLSASMKASGYGYSLDSLMAKIAVDDFAFASDSIPGVHIKKLRIDMDNISGGMNTFYLTSDGFRASAMGRIKPTSIADEAKAIMTDIFPGFNDYFSLKKQNVKDLTYNNNFVFDFTVDDGWDISRFLHLPFTLSDPMTITGEFSSDRHYMAVALDAPWMLQGNKAVQDTSFDLVLDGKEKSCVGYASSHMPTKKGPMDLIAYITGSDGKLLTNLDWRIIRDIPINGTIKFLTTVVHPDDPNVPIETIVDFSPGEITFGNEIWSILPSRISMIGKTIEVSNFALKTPRQSIDINGTVSEHPEDVLIVNLDNIQLIDIFETLEIDKAMICGYATGTIYASQLLTPSPNIHSTVFNVKDIGYNGCVLGDASIDVSFNPERASICFDADIEGEQGRQSKIIGEIVPATEGLDLQIDADHVRVGFMRPFMEAFCEDIQGYATGKAHLFGTFKYVDMTGSIYADSLRMKIGFTNTWYSASAHIPIKPGIIELENITLYDTYGNTAMLNGYVKHTYFKQPVFNFAITDAKNFLCYDVAKNIEFPWYGTVFGNGSAFINGKPGMVNININMATAAKSKFTFELSDLLQAQEYSFITFRDVTPVKFEDPYVDKPIEVRAEKWARLHKDDGDEDIPSDYVMNFAIDVNPLAEITIVMDPIGGDEIKAYGNGHMQMYYGSANDEFTMYGDYALDRGSYDFTLQSIIFKTFGINPGSRITFTGDPYNANLDITAIYQVKNANLTDLDESFMNDKDLNRTNVPVNAVMKVSGSLMQPDIDFDLEFPSLNQDAYRKVMSIVSTKEMMNRQIIYLLALNRFYTPEYMAATKGNELFSVASSTISSQLSSMLGKLSDNWSIAPNLRSDRGDFSDLEVDLSLSSTLLNNRLLLNGNFGYRDKSLNTNQFVGDFDVEYLLNRTGTLRLKAYNRYNDQSYYLRTAQTTQGIGIVVKHDFDNILGFLKRKKKPEAEITISPDSIINEIIPGAVDLPGTDDPSSADDMLKTDAESGAEDLPKAQDLPAADDLPGGDSSVF